eukprot:176660_1
MSAKHYYDIVWKPSRSDQQNQFDGMHQIHRIPGTDEVRYSVMELIAQRKHNLEIDCSQLKKLPPSIRFVTRDVNNERCMEDVTHMLIQKSTTPCKAPTQSHGTLIKQLTAILNMMTSETFHTIAKQTMDLVMNYGETKQQMKIIIGLILQHGVMRPMFGTQYAELCCHLQSHLATICDHQSTTFSKMVIQQTSELFKVLRCYSPYFTDHMNEADPHLCDKKKRNFFAMLELIGELYNVDFIKGTLIHKCVDVLLPPQNTALTDTDLEGLCRLFRRCGKKLDKESKNYMDKYFHKLMTYASLFEARTRVLVDETKDIRRNPWLAPSRTGKAPTQRTETLMKHLTGVLNRMTTAKFQKIAKQTMDLMIQYTETKQEMGIIIEFILQLAIKQPMFATQYARLCSHLHSHLPQFATGSDHDNQWMVDDADLSTTFCYMVIKHANELFCSHRRYHLKEADPRLRELKTQKFFAMMELIAELYNVELIKRNLVYRGVFEILLPPHNTSLTETDLEGLCRLLKRCGKKLDKQSKKYNDKYLQKMSTQARKFDVRTRVLVDEIKEMRHNQWIERGTLVNHLTGVLNRMTPETFDTISKQTMAVVIQYAETKQQLNIIIGTILQLAIKQPMFATQYAQLCNHLHLHLPTVCDHQWMLNDADLSTTFRKMVIGQTNGLFNSYRVEEADHQLRATRLDRKTQNFFLMMELIAELYNVELIKRNLLFRGVFEILLPPHNTSLTETDLEGLCRLLKRCGKKLDAQSKKYVDKYMQKLVTHARKFDFRTRVLTDEIKEMRCNQWNVDFDDDFDEVFDDRLSGR